jgi:hypothetical protein
VCGCGVFEGGSYTEVAEEDGTIIVDEKIGCLDVTVYEAIDV